MVVEYEIKQSEIVFARRSMGVIFEAVPEKMGKRKKLLSICHKVDCS